MQEHFKNNINKKRKYYFEIYLNNESCIFRAIVETEEERDEWVTQINDAIENLN